MAVKRYLLGALVVAAALAVPFTDVERVDELIRSFPLGNYLREPYFTADQIPDLSGKVALVTGANAGIGYETALHLAKNNAHVIMACRSKERCSKAAEAIRKVTGKTEKEVETSELDLSSFSSITTYVDKFKERGLPLHILVNNAGVMGVPFTKTEDAVETHFAVNHLGHFYLTHGLRPIIEKSAPSRIVILSSTAHRNIYPQGLWLEGINNETVYDPMKSYGRSKLANILHGVELARRLEDKNVYVNIAHPGAVNTELPGPILDQVEKFIGKAGREAVKKVIYYLTYTPLEGALTSLYLATSPEIEEKNIRGQYFIPIAQRFNPSAVARNATLAKELYEFSEKLLGAIFFMHLGRASREQGVDITGSYIEAAKREGIPPQWLP